MKAELIVHLGAGLCEELSGYLASDAKRIVLVEANPDLISALKDRTAGDRRVEVLQLAIDSQASKRTFYIYNMTEVSSLRRSTGLKDLFPGLKIMHEIEVDTVAASEFCRSLQMDQYRGVYLKLELAGLEHAIVDVLANEGLLTLIDQIEVSCGVHELYEQSSPAKAVVSRLEGKGFILEGKSCEADPDRPCFQLYLDRRQIELEKQASRIAMMETRLSELEQLPQQLAEKEGLLHCKEQEYFALQQKCNFLAEQKAQAELENRSLKENLDQMNKIISDLEAKFNEEQNRFQSTNSALKALKVEIHQKDEQIRTLKNDLSHKEKNWLSIQNENQESKRRQ
ncbi:MAG: hypothetical protein ACOH5I_21040 [Oligoflexus sp.]